MAHTDDLPSTPRPGWRDAVDNPWMLLGLLFFVLAIFGLPLLWMSRAFSTSMKVLLSIVVTIYTLVLLGCTGGVVWWGWTVVQSSL